MVLVAEDQEADRSASTLRFTEMKISCFRA